MSAQEQSAWLARAVVEVNEAVAEAQAEIALLAESQILACHVRHLERLDRLQRAVQNGAAQVDGVRSAAHMRLVGIAREKAMELSLQGPCPRQDGVQLRVKGPVDEDFIERPYDALYLEISSPTPRLRW